MDFANAASSFGAALAIPGSARVDAMAATPREPRTRRLVFVKAIMRDANMKLVIVNRC
ncbi:hypothetical protein GCM10009551_059190 [Nocardiopsis tropica]|nr:hypothetical protein TTY48_03730 [Tsukamurella sp. TY48]